MVNLQTPISEEIIAKLRVGDRIELSGWIYCGRDAVLPKLVRGEITAELQGAVIFHTAVSPAGVGPTSSNKLEIESSIEPLSAMGVKLHLGKGALHPETVSALDRYNAVYAVIPPVTALLGEKTLVTELAACPELGMEALYRLKIDAFPAIIAAAHGRSIYDK